MGDFTRRPLHQNKKAINSTDELFFASGVAAPAMRPQRRGRRARAGDVTSTKSFSRWAELVVAGGMAAAADLFFAGRDGRRGWCGHVGDATASHVEGGMDGDELFFVGRDNRRGRRSRASDAAMSLALVLGGRDSGPIWASKEIRGRESSQRAVWARRRSNASMALVRWVVGCAAVTQGPLGSSATPAVTRVWLCDGGRDRRGWRHA